MRWDSIAGFWAAKEAIQWKTWSEQDRPTRQAVTWADVKANIVVKPVASPIASDPWEIHETSLMLMECDRWSATILLPHFRV